MREKQASLIGAECDNQGPVPRNSPTRLQQPAPFDKGARPFCKRYSITNIKKRVNALVCFTHPRGTYGGHSFPAKGSYYHFSENVILKIKSPRFIIRTQQTAASFRFQRLQDSGLRVGLRRADYYPSSSNGHSETHLEDAVLWYMKRPPTKLH